MLRRRSFQLRGRNVELHELTDLIAVRSSELRRENTTDSDIDKIPFSAETGFSRLNNTILDTVATEVPLPQLRAFEDSGWVFLPRNEAGNLSGDVQEAKIFVKPGGRLALSTNKLVVKLHDDPDDHRVNKILEPCGCRVLEKLSFAPGLFRVEVNKPEQGDAVDIANQLVASGVCEFAEPELIEALSER